MALNLDFKFGLVSHHAHRGWVRLDCLSIKTRKSVTAAFTQMSNVTDYSQQAVLIHENNGCRTPLVL